jgi:hypothetical protein
MRRQLGQLSRNFVETQADPLREHDERDAPQDFTGKPPLAGALALRANEPAFFVETKRRSSDPTALRNISDRQQPGHS